MSMMAPRTRRADLVFAVTAGTLLLAAILHAAWLCDDAFITLRTASNWAAGNGLRWNVSERVQSFTHPAWLFMVAASYASNHNPTFALLTPALTASAAFVALSIRYAPDRWLAGGLLLLLLASKAFVEFSTSGLENPLVHCLLIGYFLASRRAIADGQGLTWVIGAAALLLLTRLDLSWLILPTLSASLWRARAELALARTWLGALPLVAWELFSLVYYGFPLPNTAYAKLSTGVPAEEAFTQGATYFWANLKYDPLTLSLVAAAVILALSRRRLQPNLWAIGILLWLLYLARVGGDFMIGRLLTPALVAATFIAWQSVPQRAYRWAPVAVCVTIASVLVPRSPLLGAPRQTDTRWLPEWVTDERSLAFPTTGLFREGNPDGTRSHAFTRIVVKEISAGRRVIPARSIGFAGFNAGPDIHLVDEFGLADALLARLPADPAWTPGHFSRAIPNGYLEAIAQQNPDLIDPALAPRFRELFEIIRGPLWSLDRLVTILKWNLRRPRIHPLEYQVSRVSLADLATAPQQGSVRAAGVRIPDRQGLLVNLDPGSLTRQLQVSVGANDRYLVSFRHGTSVVWHTSLEPASGQRDRLASHTLTLPRPLWVNSILIRGRKGDFRYHVGHVMSQ